MSLGKRITRFREACGMDTSYTLAKAAGVPLSVVYDLEADKTKNPRQKTLERIAAALGKTIKDLYDEEALEVREDSYTWFWKSRFSTLKPGELFGLRNAPVETRVVWCLRELTASFSVEETAARLDCPAAHITNLLHGRDVVSAWLLDRLHEEYDVPGKWLNTGELEHEWVIDKLKRVLEHPDAGTYLSVLETAMDLGILPELLVRQLDLWKQAIISKPPAV